MKLRLLLLSFPGSSLLNVILADTTPFVTTPDGIIIYADQKHKGSAITCNGKSKQFTLNKQPFY